MDRRDVIIKNKILILVYVPIMDQEYNVFIPIGKTIGTVKSVIMDTISELTEQKFINEMILINKLTGDVYDDDILVKNTQIKNGTKLLLI